MRGAVHIYTDGSLMGGRHGGWAFTAVERDGRRWKQAGQIRTASSGDAELAAVAFALKCIPDPSDVVIHTDHLGNMAGIRRILSGDERPRKGDPALWEEIRHQVRRHKSVEVEYIDKGQECPEHNQAHHGCRAAAKESMWAERIRDNQPRERGIA